MRGTVMPREVFIWIEDGQDSLTLSLVQQGFYPAAAFQDMVARDQAYRAAQERISAETGTPIGHLAFEPPAQNHPRRLISDADYIEQANRASAAETDAKRLLREFGRNASRTTTMRGRPQN